MIRHLGLIILVAFSVFTSFAQTQTKVDDVTAARFGNRDAASRIYDELEQIEASDDWGDQERQSYFDRIDALYSFFAKYRLYSELESVLDRATKTFTQRDSMANNAYMRKLVSYKAYSLFLRNEYEPGLQYAIQALGLYNEAKDWGKDYSMLCMYIGQAGLSGEAYESAEWFLNEAYKVMTELIDNGLASKNEGYYHILNQRGRLYKRQGKRDLAIGCFEEILNENSTQDIAAYYAMAPQYLAATYIEMGQYEEAINCLSNRRSTSAMTKKSYNQTLAIAYYLANQYDNIATPLANYNNAIYLDATNVILNYSETEREEYLSSITHDLLLTNIWMLDKVPSLAEEVFDANLFCRSISIAVNSALLEATKGTPERERLNALRKSFYAKSTPTDSLDNLYLEICSLENQMLRSNQDILYSIIGKVGSWKEVSSLMGDNDVMVTYCFYPRVENDETISMYGAFVARKQDEIPHFVQLCSEDDVESIFFNQNPDAEFLSDLYNSDKAITIYNFLIKPLEPYFKGASNIYYSTVGLLSTVSFDALTDKTGTRVKDKYNLVYLSSPMEIKDGARWNSSNDLVAFGAPSFNLPSVEMAAKSDSYTSFSGMDISKAMSMRSEVLRGSWAELPGTKAEIEQIVSLINKSKGNAIGYVDENASEEAFKSMNGNSPEIIHIATHGFAITDDEQYDNNGFAQSMIGINEKSTYMLMSGLILSGGNNIWRGIEIPVGVEDGILTSDEIRQLDLSNTQLVVLSACDTGRGIIDSINPIEGVWGLQRAFKQAGVKTILMTLWKVPDATTAMFMEEFYKQLLIGITVRQAVKKAQDYLIANGADDPFYWAAFVVLD